ncbi:DNA helicase RecQ [Intestinibacter bartlettii]|uniref:DNA helicase RecQ n=1 Tax=Intestinibacter bartlettii TaxID=261299 RepID=A0ABS6DUA7_9FIRM|nr:DNA helicase RecQ [Intestinibacter bartlettii]MBU5335028.1 DNA helicase RecQ [Intestinibacter bartlettii]
MKEKILSVLQKYYGYKSFRRGQEEIITSILQGEDVLAIMPTGGGKSICYQIPALCMDGLTIVISPLISLMKDQVDALTAMGIEASYINSSLSSSDYNQILENIINDKYKIIYVAPERLESAEFLNIIQNKDISQIAIDEAHCISQWGHDFRVSYKKIPNFIKNLKTRPTVTTFTATASTEVRKDILNMLGLIEPKIFITGFDRENLYINIVKSSAKNKYLLEYVENHKTENGIIYAATRKEVEKIYEGLLKRDINVIKYHAGMSNEDRKINQDKFINDEVNIIIATNAFGMGIDKPDIRWVMHYNMPQSIENYYQEIGRAGRDGEKSECVLLFTPGDVHTQKYLIEMGTESVTRKSIQYNKLQQMVDLVYSNSCYRKSILEYFGEVMLGQCDNCSNCLNEGEIIDKTLDAQKVISCIYRMKRNYGLTMIVDVLRGSKNKKVLEVGFNKLSTYGIMKDYSNEELKNFINTLVSHGFLEIKENPGARGSFPTISMNNQSLKVLKGDIKVEFKEVKVAKESRNKNELFEVLSDLRKTIAVKEKIAPYMVFGDATLLSMANTYPTTKDELLNISGVGQVKYEKYGQEFINEIEKYISDNNIDKIALIKQNDSNTDDKEEFFEVKTDKNLYELLKKVRAKYARIEGIPYHMIMPKNTLKEISGRYPLDIEQLNDITGLGPKKIDKYGESIIEVVNNYVDEKNIEVKWREKKKKKLILDGESRKPKEIALDLLNQGMDIKSVSNELEISVYSILGFIYDYIKEDNELHFKFDPTVYYCEDEKELIEKSINKFGEDKMRDIKKSLPDYIRYESIRAVIIQKYIS